MRDLNLTVADFAGIYVENPSRMYKAVVKDRTQFKTIWDESRLTQPAALQDTIDQLVQEVGGGKAFVRPSGTEDILRIYAEASTPEKVEQLGNAILKEIEDKYKDL